MRYLLLIGSDTKTGTPPSPAQGQATLQAFMRFSEEAQKAGKTIVAGMKEREGRMVAERLHAGFVDIDTILIRKEGKPIAMIFAEKGESAFRDMERKEVETALLPVGLPAALPQDTWGAGKCVQLISKVATVVMHAYPVRRSWWF